MYAHVVPFFRDEPYLLSYEDINQPNPDFDTWNCMGQPTFLDITQPAPPYTSFNAFNAVVNCPTFYNTLYAAFKQRFNSIVRPLDPKHLIQHDLTFYEVITQLPVISKESDPNTVVGTQEYTAHLPLEQYWAGVVQNTAEANNSAYIITEFGDTLDSLPDLATSMRFFDTKQASWAYWTFVSSVLGPESGQILLNPDLPPSGTNINQDILNTIVEPYPRVIAGTPLSYSYNPASNVFNFAYSSLRADGNGMMSHKQLTEVFIPSSKYPSGYIVTVTGAKVVSKSNASLLLLKRNEDANIVSVVVTSR